MKILMLKVFEIRSKAFQVRLFLFWFGIQTFNLWLMLSMKIPSIGGVKANNLSSAQKHSLPVPFSSFLPRGTLLCSFPSWKTNKRLLNVTGETWDRSSLEKVFEMSSIGGANYKLRKIGWVVDTTSRLSFSLSDWRRFQNDCFEINFQIS